MNLNQLKYIVTIADELNISKAAQKLYVSQPSLSQCIQSIEKELGTRLFERNTTPLKITYAGEIYINWARGILTSTEDIKKQISDISGHKNVKLIIGISPYRSTCILPPVIKELKKHYPNCNVLIEEHPTTILHTMMDENKIDILIDTPHPNTIDYTSIPLMKENILIELPKSWGITGEEISISELSQKPFIMLSNIQLLGKLSRDLCIKNGFTPKVVVECHTVETAHSLVNQGLGATFIPELFIKNLDKKSTKFYKIKDFQPQRDFCVIYNNKKYLSSVIKDFIKILDKYLNKQTR